MASTYDKRTERTEACQAAARIRERERLHKLMLKTNRRISRFEAESAAAQKGGAA